MHLKYPFAIWNFVWYSSHWYSSGIIPTSNLEMSSSYGIMQSYFAVWGLLELFKFHYPNKTYVISRLQKQRENVLVDYYQ